MKLEKAIEKLEDKLNYLQARIVIAKDNPQTKESYIKEMSEEKQAIETVLQELERKEDKIKNKIKELEKKKEIKAEPELLPHTNSLNGLNGMTPYHAVMTVLTTDEVINILKELLKEG